MSTNTSPPPSNDPASIGRRRSHPYHRQLSFQGDAPQHANRPRKTLSLSRGVSMKSSKGSIHRTPSSTSRRPRENPNQAKCLQVMPGIFVAIEDTDDLPSSSSSSNKTDEFKSTNTLGALFTHVVSIRPFPVNASSDSEPRTITSHYSPDRSQLLLTVPSPLAGSDGSTDLTLTQLIAARDFLTNSGYTDTLHANQHHDVRILITTPVDLAVDAVAALTCYLAASSGYQVADVLMTIFQDEGELYDDEDGGYPPSVAVWKDLLSEYGMEIVDEAARAP